MYRIGRRVFRMNEPVKKVKNDNFNSENNSQKEQLNGKEARRTNTSSPLDKLFDHGNDSISTARFCAVGLLISAYWQIYVSGTLCFGKIDESEPQLTIIGIYLILTVFDLEFCVMKLRYFGCEERSRSLCFAFDINLLLDIQYAKTDTLTL
uniref:Uncharacterized protein n=1 Tax=Glossina palpalis gambiensis TaxID=67801 RepID=A0A1B0C7S2_9MUSC